MLRSDNGCERPRGRLARLTPMLAVLAALAVGVSAAAQGGGESSKTKAGAGPCALAHSGPSKLTQPEAAQAVHCLLNKRRANHGISPFGSNDNLGTTAQRHTDHMLIRQCFAHECPGESGITTRIQQTGYMSGAKSWGVGENIAAGRGDRGSPAKIVAAWMDSPPHRATILSPKFQHVGVGMVHSTPFKPQGGGATYTTDFGYSEG